MFRPFRRIAERIRARREGRRDPDGPEPAAPDPPPPARPAPLTWSQRIMVALLNRLFGAAPGAVSGFINTAELWKSFGVSGLGGALVALLTVILTTVSAHAAAIFSPPVAGLATVVITVMLTQLAKISQGPPAIVTPAKLVPEAQPAARAFAPSDLPRQD